MKFYTYVYDFMEELWFGEDKTKIVEIIKIFRYTMIPVFIICVVVPFNLIINIGLWGGLLMGHPKLTEIKIFILPHVYKFFLIL